MYAEPSEKTITSDVSAGFHILTIKPEYRPKLRANGSTIVNASKDAQYFGRAVYTVSSSTGSVFMVFPNHSTTYGNATYPWWCIKLGLALEWEMA